MRPPIVLLCGGKGTRLHSITGDAIPKPMVEVCGKPFLHWLILHYMSQGFVEIALSTGHLAEQIESYPWPMPVRFERDHGTWVGLANYDYSHRVIANGDTFIPDPLPTDPGPWICVKDDVDAGAQKPGRGEIKVHPVSDFFDIGTPDGLKRFEDYFRTHLANK